jgi:hypothetical protein
MTAITALEQVTESRLCWPDGKPRSALRVNSPFKTEVAKATLEIEYEMERWRIGAYIISRNNQRVFAGDPAAALWWLDNEKQLRVLAADKYTTLAANLHAIYLTLDAMRALERWGAYSAEQAAEGAKLLALPSPDAPPHWSLVIQVDRAWPLPAIEGMYRSAMKGADPERMRALNAAIEAARAEKGA